MNLDVQASRTASPSTWCVLLCVLVRTPQPPRARDRACSRANVSSSKWRHDSSSRMPPSSTFSAPGWRSRISSPRFSRPRTTCPVALASVNNTLGRPIDAPIEVLAELDAAGPGPERYAARSASRDRRTIPSGAEALRRRPQRARRSCRCHQVRAPAPDLRPPGSVSTRSAPRTSPTLPSTRGTWALSSTGSSSTAIGSLPGGALRSQKTQKEFDERTFRNALSVEPEASPRHVDRALEALEVTTLTVEQAREAERVAEESLAMGAATTLDVLQATLALRQSELNQTTAAHDALVALAEMKYLVGFRADAPNSTIEAPHRSPGPRRVRTKGANLDA